MDDKDFLTDIQTIRRRARQHMQRGPVTPGYRGHLPTILRLLNEALATEIVRGGRPERGDAENERHESGEATDG